MLDPKCGPFGNLWQATASALDALAKGTEPTAVAVSRWHLELTALALRRARAWLEIPTRLRQCTSGQELAREQVRFWQEAGGHYSEGAQRLMAALMSAAVTAAPAGREARSAHETRDYIAVAERPPARTPGKDRRAA